MSSGEFGDIPAEAINFSVATQPEKEPEYDTEAWGRLTASEEGFGWLIQQGERLGVPTKEIDKAVVALVAKMEGAGNYGKVFHFMKGSKTGQRLYGPDKVKEFGLRAVEAAKAAQDFSTAAGLTCDLFGLDSPEWRVAVELATVKGREQEQKEKAAKKNKIRLLPDASFADLFQALSDSGEDLNELFEAELADNFSPEVVEDILGLMKNSTAAENLGVVDFFKKHGYSKKDITTFLPIGFKRK
ncbi:MAG: hypothetical protein UX09_C0028G0010 [Candidatus Uhrbacteria bacterium GW2011_GWE2_45_35]|uniref:Uncharacterized protein n=1 Tax=Candidatus Uhrbacteria bacterium GW2011_GWE2_45_35 TaxID=1618993 RepID=A0A0G1QFV6_9BACT|nr:MAG: hypothetical protein UX09_C0028G0010 [Candidatus Uhrbacteria bacterium GW2011_GWE2_45_35]HBR80148.1 hypothetical protein [Candidatus Uhrbacteria bacterium]HCU31337.1 hypothetical protein [Candidatus Uhrbacteria bacterium]